jgi:hypothetical protein
VSSLGLPFAAFAIYAVLWVAGYFAWANRQAPRPPVGCAAAAGTAPDRPEG